VSHNPVSHQHEATETLLVPVAPSRGQLQPLGLDEVHITGGFWGDRQRRNGQATLPHILRWLNQAGWAGNFDDVASGAPASERHGREFADSEIYKTLEALAWQLGWSADPTLQEAYDALVKRVAAAQGPDGYLNTAFGRPGQGQRYSDLEWGHELYCYGHLLQAAVARLRTGHDDLLVQVARAVADHIVEEFGPEGRQQICGHPEVELGLAEFGRATGDRRYLDQAALFIERRGHATLADIEFGRSYFQDDVPFRDAESLRGHAVRALYLAASAVDVAVENDDETLLEAAERQLSHALSRRTYLTGGMGSHHQDEAFGEDWVLPPDRSYSETCAGIGSVMLSWRLLLATGRPQYADLIERTLYNVVSTSPAQDGLAFFYTNTLHQRIPGTPADPDAIVPRAASSLRAPWFEVSCCPTNVARTLASLAGYLATKDEGGVQLHQYADSSITTTLADGRVVHLEIETGYPNDGTVVIRSVNDNAEPWDLTLRIPAWATGATLTDADGTREVSPGTVTISRAFRQGDEIRLQLPLDPRWVRPDERVDAVRGCVALERGPLVLCVESVDLPDSADVADVVIDTTVEAKAVTSENLPAAEVSGYLVERADATWPYFNAEPGATTEPVTMTLRPYFSWGNRGPATMRVWIPQASPARKS
jgi:DUF1680 family protein